MALVRWQATVQDDNGNAVVNPSITVRNAATNALALIYDDAGLAKSNPFIGGADGFVSFKANPGRYIVEGASGDQIAEDWIVDLVAFDGFASYAGRSEAVVAANVAGWSAGAVISDGMVQYKYSGIGSVISDMPGWVPYGDVVMPFHFGDTGSGGWQAAINAAISAINAQGGGKLVIPATSVPYEITGPIVIKSNVHVDFGKAQIKLANGANCDMIQTDGFYSLTGTNNYAPNGSPRNFSLSGGIFDGNSANQSPADPDACNGMALYGYGFTIKDMEFRNVRGNGYRGEWGQFGGESVGHSMESKVANCRFDTSGRRGFWHKGPHDAHFDHIVVIDASQEADNTYDAIVSEGYGGARWYNPHAWHRSGAVNRARWAGNFVCGGNEILGGHLEGCRRQYRTLGANMTVGIHCYAPRSDNAQIEISGERNTFHGRFTNSTENPRPTVLALGATATCGMSDINLTAVVGAAGPSNPLVQVAASVGNNSIRIRSAGADAANMFTGSFDDFDDVTISQEFPSRINYRRPPFIASGAASRPSPAAPGQYHFDTGLGKPIWRNGANTAWVDATGATV